MRHDVYSFFFPAAGLHYTPMTFSLIFKKNGNKSQFLEIPISTDNMIEGSKNFKVVLSFINYSNGQAVSNQEMERIHLGDDAQVTIYSDIPTSDTIKMDTTNWYITILF